MINIKTNNKKFAIRVMFCSLNFLKNLFFQIADL